MATSTKKYNANLKLNQLYFKLEDGSARRLFCTFVYSFENVTAPKGKTNSPNGHIQQFDYKWEYRTADSGLNNDNDSFGFGGWFSGDSGSVDGTLPDSKETGSSRTIFYDIPENAVQVRLFVKGKRDSDIKNSSKNGYWTESSSWTQFPRNNDTGVPYPYDAFNIIAEPETPSVTYKTDIQSIECEVSGYEPKTYTDFSGETHEYPFFIRYQVIQDDSSIFADETGSAGEFGVSKQIIKVDLGHSYKVRMQAVSISADSGLNSVWSDYSDTIYTAPVVTGVKSAIAYKDGYAEIGWNKIDQTGITYVVRYSDKIENLDKRELCQEATATDTDYVLISGLTGAKYYYKVSATSETGGEGPWSDIFSMEYGTVSTAATTWSSMASASENDTVWLYWTHNCADGSRETKAELKLYLDDEYYTTITILNGGRSEGEDYSPISKCYINASDLFVDHPNGVKLTWSVRTTGAIENFSDTNNPPWSIERVVNFYVQPTAELTSSDITEYTRFPLRYRLTSTMSSNQTPLVGDIKIVAKTSYDDVDNYGEAIHINANDVLMHKQVFYNEAFDTQHNTYAWFIIITPDMVTLYEGVEYLIMASVTYDSGLVATASPVSLTPIFEDSDLIPLLSADINTLGYTAMLYPACMSAEEGNPPFDAIIDIYRRTVENEFIAIATGIRGTDTTYTTVVDPHPSLDLARYRVVATDPVTGRRFFYDEAFEIGCKSIIIQWDEKWVTQRNIDQTDGDYSDPPWAGSLLKLDYNIDISDSNKPEVELVSYIGRSNPVTYYGTKRNSTATWSTSVPAEDKETLFQLRRLSRYAGDVYIREPGGQGYWANVNLDIATTHCELTVPISLAITRVEGGI